MLSNKKLEKMTLNNSPFGDGIGDPHICLRGATGLALLVLTQRVGGSSPFEGTTFGSIAQLIELQAYILGMSGV
jgi:hypothetical protein